MKCWGWRNLCKFAESRKALTWDKLELQSMKAAIITHVVVLVLWSIKNGLPLGACRTSQPLGRNPCSTSGCWLEHCCDESPDVACGCLAIEVFCAVGNWPASIAICRQKNRTKITLIRNVCRTMYFILILRY